MNFFISKTFFQTDSVAFDLLPKYHTLIKKLDTFSNQQDSYYEVFERRLTNNFYGGKTLPGRKEQYPKGEHFGDWAWTNHIYKKALKYYEEITEKKKSKEK